MTDAAHSIPTAPACVRRDRGRFQPRSWESYTWEELYWWVKLLCKRAGNRTEHAGTDRDLAAAHDYLAMAQAKLDHLRTRSHGRPVIEDLLESETGEQHVAAMTARLDHTMTALARVATGRRQP